MADSVTDYAVLLPVTQENGVVRYHNKTIWVQCPSCGPQPPIVRWLRGTLTATVKSPKDSYEASLLTCSNCGGKAPYRKSKTPVNGKGKCGSRCWNGKTVCNCICAGKCHGEGFCRCNGVRP